MNFRLFTSSFDFLKLFFQQVKIFFWTFLFLNFLTFSIFSQIKPKFFDFFLLKLIWVIKLRRNHERFAHVLSQVFWSSKIFVVLQNFTKFKSVLFALVLSTTVFILPFCIFQTHIVWGPMKMILNCNNKMKLYENKMLTTAQTDNYFSRW